MEETKKQIAKADLNHKVDILNNVEFPYFINAINSDYNINL